MNLPVGPEPGAAREKRPMQAIVPAFWRKIPPARRLSLVWPREHGAWGILLVSLITGVAAGFSPTSDLPQLLWLTLAVTAAFCLRAPLENSLPGSPFHARGSAERRWVTLAVLLYVLGGAFAVGMLIRSGALGLIWIPAVVATGLFVLQAIVKRFGRAGRLLGEITGAFGLAVVALVGWAVAAGRFDPHAVALWLMNGLFATNQILYVQLRIHEARKSRRSLRSRRKMLFLAGEGLTTVVLIVAWQAGLIPGLALVAFLPVLVRGAAWSFSRAPRPLQIRRLGKTELAHAIVFGILVIFSFRLSIPGATTALVH